MKNTNGNLPAMPNSTLNRSGSIPFVDVVGGLTKRETLAMAAMQGILAKGGSGKLVTERAVEYADALLTELERQA
jgi:hypothetical protein